LVYLLKNKMSNDIISRLMPEIKPVARINVEKRRLEWVLPTHWETPTTVKLDPVLLYAEYDVRSMADEIERLRSKVKRSSAQAGVPEGWKLVPVEPTPEMLATTSWPGCAATDYAHMLAAVPQPPSTLR